MPVELTPEQKCSLVKEICDITNHLYLNDPNTNGNSILWWDTVGIIRSIVSDFHTGVSPQCKLGRALKTNPSVWNAILALKENK